MHLAYQKFSLISHQCQLRYKKNCEVSYLENKDTSMIVSSSNCFSNLCIR